MLALPSLLLALVLVAISGPSIGNAALALTFVALPHYVPLTRAAVLVEVNRDYVTASGVAGMPGRCVRCLLTSSRTAWRR